MKPALLVVCATLCACGTLKPWSLGDYPDAGAVVTPDAGTVDAALPATAGRPARPAPQASDRDDSADEGQNDADDTQDEDDEADAGDSS